MNIDNITPPFPLVHLATIKNTDGRDEIIPDIETPGAKLYYLVALDIDNQVITENGITYYEAADRVLQTDKGLMRDVLLKGQELILNPKIQTICQQAIQEYNNKLK